jgi:uncharacterized membrane protein YphA (DoxX/SURF4 family)
MRSLYVLGRVMFGGYFLYNGVNHFLNEKMTSGALLAAGGLSIVAGVKPKQGLAAVIGFLIPVTLQTHRFWEETDPQQRMNETIHFGKNLALVGAALTMLQIAEPWPISVDDAHADGEEMFIRLGGRDLRALPA